jgi:hypothetical protein
MCVAGSFSETTAGLDEKVEFETMKKTQARSSKIRRCLQVPRTVGRSLFDVILSFSALKAVL